MGKFLSILSGAAILGIAMVSLIEGSFQSPKEGGILLNNIKGMAIEHNHKLYTLNFHQQNRAAQILNHVRLYSEISSNDEFQGSDTSPYSRLIIYRFEKGDLEVIPLGRGIFKVRGQDQPTPAKEMESFELHALLSQTYELRSPC